MYSKTDYIIKDGTFFQAQYSLSVLSHITGKSVHDIMEPHKGVSRILTKYECCSLAIIQKINNYFCFFSFLQVLEDMMPPKVIPYLYHIKTCFSSFHIKTCFSSLHIKTCFSSFHIKTCFTSFHIYSLALFLCFTKEQVLSITDTYFNLCPAILVRV